MNPFLDLSVVPMYGQQLARLVWRLAKGYELGKCIIFKSPDGVNNWREIGSCPAKLGGFVDSNLLVRGKWEEYYYRVILQVKGSRFDSDVVSTFGKIDRAEFGVARVILEREWMTLRRFTPVKIFKLRSDGAPCTRCVDAETQQKIGISLCPVCYSTGFEGGYYPAIDSYMHLGNISTKVQEDSREGAGSTDPVNVHARMAAYPNLEKEDMVINPKADRRYLIDTIDYALFNGVIPVYAEMNLQLMDRKDIRYTFPL